MRKRLRLVLTLALGTALLLAAPIGARHLGRRVSWFDVRRVEVIGATLVPPHELLEASGIQPGNSLFDSSTPWESALERHPVVKEAAVSRRLPATVRIRIEEKEPIALVDGEVLGVATATGEVLPVDPTRAPADLPIVRGELRDDQPMQRTVLLEELERLRTLDPSLVASLSELAAAGESGVLLLRHAEADILLPVGSGWERLAQLDAVLRDVAARRAAITAAPEAPADTGTPTIDLRFEEQIVVRNPLSRELP